jgi:hypothetical protein
MPGRALRCCAVALSASSSAAWRTQPAGPAFAFIKAEAQQINNLFL